jgi:hypothetical protein
MIVVNFSHALTTQQQEQLFCLTGRKITAILDVPTMFDLGRLFAEQTTELVDTVSLTRDQWQTETLLIVLPPYAPITATTLAELHGRMGYFPAIARIRPIPDSKPTKFEVADLINLQAIRENARMRR